MNNFHAMAKRGSHMATDQTTSRKTTKCLALKSRLTFYGLARSKQKARTNAGFLLGLGSATF